MGFFSGIFGGGGSSTSSSQATTVKNTNNNFVDIHFEELAEIEALALEETKVKNANDETWRDYLISTESQEVITEEQKNKVDTLLRVAKLKQDEATLKQSKINSSLTVFFAVVGIILTFWQIKKKGK